MLGDGNRPTGYGDMITRSELLICEIQETNAHLRSNTMQFVNWFSFFLLSSYAAAFGLWLLKASQLKVSAAAVSYGIPIVVLILHIFAFVGIIVFRRYTAASNALVCQLGSDESGPARSSIPARFYQWMTNLMAAGYVVSYFVWLSLLIFP